MRTLSLAGLFFIEYDIMIGLGTGVAYFRSFPNQVSGTSVFIVRRQEKSGVFLGFLCRLLVEKHPPLTV